MLSFEERLKTFTRWPKSIPKKPREIAEAGFTNKGRFGKYLVQCAECNYELYFHVRYDEGIDPWVCHAARYPPCSFVVAERGDKFVIRRQSMAPPRKKDWTGSVSIPEMQEFCEAAGLDLDYDELFKDCWTYQHHVDALIDCLKDPWRHYRKVELTNYNLRIIYSHALRNLVQATKGKPTLEKCRIIKTELEKYREIAERDEHDKQRSKRAEERERWNRESTREEKQRGQEKQQDEQESEQGGQESEQGGQEREHGGQEREHGGQENEQGGQEREHGGQENEQGGQESEQGGQENEQGGQESEQGGQESEQGGQESEQGRQQCSRMLSFAERLKTFAEWPKNLPTKPQEIAEAGFTYAGRYGKKYLVQCAECKYSLNFHEHADEVIDPWVCHASRYPPCSFVVAEKGDEFVARCQRMAPPRRKDWTGSVSVPEMQEFCEAAGLDLDYDEVFKGCWTYQHHVDALIDCLREPWRHYRKVERYNLCIIYSHALRNLVQATKGKPTLEKCRKIKTELEKYCEIAERDEHDKQRSKWAEERERWKRESTREEKQRGQEKQQDEQGSEQGGQESEQGGQDSEKGGQESEQGGQESEQGGRESEQSGRESEQSGQESQQGGQESEQGGQESEQGGQESEQGGQQCSRMLSLAERLKTFAEWPKNIPTKPQEIAEAGFTYAGRHGKKYLHVQCAECNYSFNFHEHADKVTDPWVRHASRYPPCRFVVAEKGDEFVTHCQRMAPPRKKGWTGSFSIPEMQEFCEAAGLDLDYDELFKGCWTYQHHVDALIDCLREPWLHYRKVEPTDYNLWFIYFYYALRHFEQATKGKPTLEKCRKIKTELEKWREVVERSLQRDKQRSKRAEERERWKRESMREEKQRRQDKQQDERESEQGGQESEQGGQESEQDGQQCSRMLSYAERLKTFAKWPKHIPTKPQEIAEAGFTYLRPSDKKYLVQCAECHFILYFEEIPDVIDPWQCHAWRYPPCNFVVAEKGDEFVARCQRTESWQRKDWTGSFSIPEMQEFCEAAGLDLDYDELFKDCETYQNRVDEMIKCLKKPWLYYGKRDLTNEYLATFEERVRVLLLQKLALTEKPTLEKCRKIKLRLERLQCSLQRWKGSKQDGQESEQSRQESQQGGQESHQDGQENEQGGQESEQAEQESEQDGQESEQDGQESDQDGQESDQDGQESEQAEQESEQDGQESDQDWQESEQDGQESEQDGQESDQDGQESEQGGQGSEQAEQETERGGQESQHGEQKKKWSYDERLGTFVKWAADHPLRPQALAKAGFVWAGEVDVVCCTECDLRLYDWKEGEDPWALHASKFPPCDFVRDEKGTAFINRHQVKGGWDISVVKYYCKVAGIRYDYKTLVKDCLTYQDRVNKFIALLNDAGIEGIPNVKKCRALKAKKKREEKENKQRGQKTDHSEQERAQRGPEGDHSGQERAQRGPEEDHSGQERAQRGPEEDHSGQERAQRGAEGDHSGHERAQRGPEEDHSGQERAHRGPEEDHSGQERAQRGPEGDQSVQERAQRGPEGDHSGQERAQRGAEEDHSGQERAQRGPEEDHSGQERAQRGAEGDHSGHERAQRGPEEDHSGQERAQRGPEEDHSGQERAQRGPEGDQSVQERAQRGPEGDHSGQERAQRGPEEDQSGQERAQRGPEGDQSGQERAQRGPEGDQSGQKRDQSRQKSEPSRQGVGTAPPRPQAPSSKTTKRKRNNCGTNQFQAKKSCPDPETPKPSDCEHCSAKTDQPSPLQNIFVLGADDYREVIRGRASFVTITNNTPLKRATDQIPTVPDKKAKLCCDKCDKSYTRRENLNKHIAAEHEYPKTCENCSESFNNHSSFSKHRNTCGKSASAKIKTDFDCPQCSKSFFTESFLQNHIKTQHERNDKICLTCGEIFTSASSCKKHKETCGNDATSVTDGDEPQNAQETSSNPSQIPCKLCLEEPVDIAKHYLDHHNIRDPSSMLVTDRTFLIPTGGNQHRDSTWFSIQFAKAMERYTDTVCRLCDRDLRHQLKSLGLDDLEVHYIGEHNVNRKFLCATKRLIRKDGI